MVNSSTSPPPSSSSSQKTIGGMASEIFLLWCAACIQLTQIKKNKNRVKTDTSRYEFKAANILCHTGPDTPLEILESVWAYTMCQVFFLAFKLNRVLVKFSSYCLYLFFYFVEKKSCCFVMMKCLWEILPFCCCFSKILNHMHFKNSTCSFKLINLRKKKVGEVSRFWWLL